MNLKYVIVFEAQNQKHLINFALLDTGINNFPSLCKSAGCKCCSGRVMLREVLEVSKGH